MADHAAAVRPLQTAIVDDNLLLGAQSELAFARVAATGATAVRLGLYWKDVAPERPLAESDPADPAYRWGQIDSAISLAVHHGLEPILSVQVAPAWAELGTKGQPGTRRPDPAAYGLFLGAASQRFSGRVPGLPRVRYWQIWNEPNLDAYLMPQFENGRPVSPAHYRAMLNAGARAVRATHPDNVVVAGALSPFGFPSRVVAPLRFMRELLCLSRTGHSTCSARTAFDVWSHHPYTSGGPTHSARAPDDASMGDLGEMRRILRAAERAGHVDGRRKTEFWITEFSWDSNPPDPKGVPVTLQARWVAEALYRSWTHGVSLFTWFTLRDDRPATSFFQSSLFFRGSVWAADRPKPALQAFRFPLVAIPKRGGILVWGRTPAGEPGRIVIQETFKGGWRTLGTLGTDRNGIFTRTFAGVHRGSVRAQLLGRPDRAPSFSLKRVPDRLFSPFGISSIGD